MVVETNTLKTQCCIVGGGPAGMMLGLLLARAGVRVTVLEKHADFLRDFRGDTIHPSTLELMHELGLLETFLQRPHQRAERLSGFVGGTEIPFADFTHLPTRCGYVAFMPQWDFLDFIAAEADRYPDFELRMESEVTDLLRDGDSIKGVVAATPDGELRVHADLVVGTDGRSSTVREKAGLKVRDLGAPMDVLWMRLPREDTDPEQPLARFARGGIFVMIYRGDYWQCGYVIPKGGFDRLRSRGIESLHRHIAEVAPDMESRLDTLADWDDVSLLSVKVDRLQRWYREGLLCIGDAAHAMSPVGGVGINLAIQDAVAAANLLSRPLRGSFLTEGHLRQVQERRLFPARATQRIQVLIQQRIIDRVLTSDKPLAPPAPLKLLRHLPFLQRIPARVIGLGIRPEHIARHILDHREE